MDPDPDPHQNVMDPQHWCRARGRLRLSSTRFFYRSGEGGQDLKEQSLRFMQSQPVPGTSALLLSTLKLVSVRNQRDSRMRLNAMPETESDTGISVVMTLSAPTLAKDSKITVSACFFCFYYLSVIFRS